MEQQKIEQPETATLADMKSVCDSLIDEGYMVYIEYKNKKITVYGNKTNMEIEKLKERFVNLALHPPAPQSKEYDDYQMLIHGLEVELREAGVQL